MPKLYRGLIKDRQPHFRTENLGRLLLMALTNWQDALVHGLRSEGHSSIRAAHINLLRHIDMDGTRVTEIAERAGVTKQAVGQLVGVCKDMNLVDTVPDPNDGRAKIVRFTEYGHSVILAQTAVFERIDAELETLLGPDAYEQMRQNLGKLADWKAATERSKRASGALEARNDGGAT